jgi:hypothetical protein
MTQLELMMALSVVLVGLIAFLQAVISSQVLSQTNRENAIASQAARQALEAIHEVPFEDVFATYAGQGFAVDGLDPLPDDPDGLAGEYVFPTISAGGVLELREDAVDGHLGSPRDLDGNSVVDAADHAKDYVVLPVLVRVQWRGKRVQGTVEMKTILAGR